MKAQVYKPVNPFGEHKPKKSCHPTRQLTVKKKLPINIEAYLLLLLFCSILAIAYSWPILSIIAPLRPPRNGFIA